VDKLGIATEDIGADLASQAPKTGRVWDVVVIEGDRWGSSGYYPGDVLERDGARAFPAGTQSFEDHAEPGAKDLVGKMLGVTLEPARFVVEDGVPKLRAPIEFFEDKIDYVKARAKATGISIRSGVKFAPGERGGRFGKIVTALTEGISIDVVTRAGAGGKFGVIMESAQPGQAESEIQEGSDMPLTKEERAEIAAESATAIANALKPTFDAFTTALGDLKKTQVAESAGTALTLREINTKITAAKLSEKGAERVYTAIEGAEVATEKFVDTEIAREVSMKEEAAAEAKAKLEEGGIVFNEDGTVHTEETASEEYKAGDIGAWKAGA